MWEKKTIPLAYWNCGRVAIAVVVVANYCNGDLLDWAAYIGGTTETWREEDAYEEAAKYGNKLALRDAKHFASHLGLEPSCYRA